MPASGVEAKARGVVLGDEVGFDAVRCREYQGTPAGSVAEEAGASLAP